MTDAVAGGPVVGIDASNLRGGGGLTHLRELLAASDPDRHGFRRIVVWAGKQSLKALPQGMAWVDLRHESRLDRSLVRRMWWVWHRLPKLADEECDVLLVPGGLGARCAIPWVTMCRNMLPFESAERRRYGLSPTRLRLELLRRLQSRAFSEADGTVFLTNYARTKVTANLVKAPRKPAVIPHGVNERFYNQAVSQAGAEEGTANKRTRLLYVSTVNEYKHQWNVCEAVAGLRAGGVDAELHLIGGSTANALSRLQEAMRRMDPTGTWITYHGPSAFDILHEHYHKADVFIFASSCENMPNTLLEAMASALPIACSSREPMPEILGRHGVYFDPERPKEIAAALRSIVDDRDHAATMGKDAQAEARAFTWDRCASRTFEFLREVSQLSGT